jgi:hypothetical protein
MARQQCGRSFVDLLPGACVFETVVESEKRPFLPIRPNGMNHLGDCLFFDNYKKGGLPLGFLNL